MIFNDTSSAKDGLIQECETWLFGSNYGAISDNADLMATFTRLLNNGQSKAQLEIKKSDGRFQFHSPNKTTFPIDTTDLEQGVTDYQLERYHLDIEGVEVKDSNGNWYPLSQIDQHDIRRKGHAYSEFMDEPGRPQYYDLIGDSIYLFPAPDSGSVTVGTDSKSLKVFYRDETYYFTTSDTNKYPDVPTPLHWTVPVFACLQYAQSNQMGEKARELEVKEVEAKEAIRYHVKSRNKDHKPRLQARYKSAA